MDHYNNLSEVQFQLLQKGAIDLNGEVDAEMLCYVRSAIMKLNAAGSPPLSVFINSGGGNIKFGMAIYDLLAHYGQTTGILLNFGYSIAAIILQACQKRLIAEHGTVIIHNPTRHEVTWQEFFNERENQKTRQEMERDRELFIEVLLARTGQTRKTIIAALNRGQEMKASEALRFGLVDEIIKPERIPDDKASVVPYAD